MSYFERGTEVAAGKTLIRVEQATTAPAAGDIHCPLLWRSTGQRLLGLASTFASILLCRLRTAPALDDSILGFSNLEKSLASLRHARQAPNIDTEGEHWVDVIPPDHGSLSLAWVFWRLDLHCFKSFSFYTYSKPPCCRITFTVASQALYDWALQFWDNITSALPRNPYSKPQSVNDRILEVLTTYTTASYTSVAVLLISLIFLGYRYLMGDRWYSGRGSPFSLADNGPRNLSGHFEYISDDHDLYTRSPVRPSFSTGDGYPELDDNNPNAPDRIHCRYMASSFPLDFAAYSINEEKTLVEDLRRKVADKLGVDPRKVRLIYKGRDLKHNLTPLKRYKMKQNSEVSVVITERAVDYYTPDQNSDSGSDKDSSYLTANPRRQQRPRAHSTIRLRSDEKIPVMESNGGTYLSPNGHLGSTPVERRHRDSLHPDPDYGRDRDDRHRERGRERDPSRGPARRREPSREPSRGPARDAPRRAVSPAPPPKPTAPPADPNSPLGKVQALSSAFYTQWLPPAVAYLANPPSDAAVREKEFLKLSESIMQKVVLAADNIDTEGNIDARNERKSLINETNRILKELDARRHG